MAVMMAMMVLGIAPMGSPHGAPGASQDHEELLRDQLTWAMSWCNGRAGGGPATGEAGDGAGRLVEDGAESAPDEEELAGNGSRPLSEEDREFLH